MCHAGDNTAATEAEAHSGLIAFPGNLDNAALTCGSCHGGLMLGNDELNYWPDSSTNETSQTNKTNKTNQTKCVMMYSLRTGVFLPM